MILDHPQRGCHCPEHEKQRTYGREYARTYKQRKAAGELRDYSRRTTNRPPSREQITALVKQGIALGEPTSVIMRHLGVSYETVATVRAEFEAAD